MSKGKNIPRKIELLAPARDANTAIEAIKHGADAVYMGATSHGARSVAGNSLEDIAKVVDFAHQFNVKVYITINTIIYNNEIKTVEQLIHNLYRIGVDALIVQDMGILRMNIPPIALHASTQCDTRSVEKAKFLEKVGFSQIVLARELSFEEIAKIHNKVNVPLEAFVHGALCVSYSGDCQASCVAKGRSANRGECAQMCRLPYSLIDNKNHILVKDKYLLSLRDLNRSADIEAMLEAGVSSFKIEGRLKDVGYVKNTVAAYRKIIDRIIEQNPNKYQRSSLGTTTLKFTPALNKSFNRGYTRYFADKNSIAHPMASLHSPKSIGEPVTQVKRNLPGGAIMIKELSVELHNGDGLGYFDKNNKFYGFRLNRIENNTLYPASQVNIPIGTTIYRNKDKQWDDELAQDTALRTIDIEMILRIANNRILALDICDCRGNAITSTLSIEPQQAKTPQLDARRRTLEKLGGTIYRLISLTDNVGDIFIPASQLADLRRNALALLDKAQKTRYSHDIRLPEDASSPLPMGNELSYHDNVANHLAQQFYKDHGATVITPAIEIQQPDSNETIVMTTRYCLRREMGCCLKTPQGKTLPSPLFLTTGNTRFQLHFDCQNCQMQLINKK
ncbi:MAG: U32 family peptidase [Bacteroidales bacterium]|nr:U32 family peptidase [Bacteroidales bacterium]